MMQVEWDTTGFEGVHARIRAMSDFREEIMDILSGASEIAATEMQARAPRGRNSEIAMSVDQGPIAYLPGGFGGGGFYETAVSVGEGVEHFIFVTEGTGMWGPKKRPYTAKLRMIRGRRRRGFMQFNWFRRGDILIRARSVKGQPPQRDFIAWAHYQADTYIAERVEALDLGG